MNKLHNRQEKEEENWRFGPFFPLPSTTPKGSKKKAWRLNMAERTWPVYLEHTVCVEKPWTLWFDFDKLLLQRPIRYVLNPPNRQTNRFVSISQQRRSHNVPKRKRWVFLQLSLLFSILVTVRPCSCAIYRLAWVKKITYLFLLSSDVPTSLEITSFVFFRKI